MCIPQFRTEAKMYSKIMQNMKNARKQLKIPAWHRRPTDKLSAAARRSSKVGGGGATGAAGAGL